MELLAEKSVGFFHKLRFTRFFAQYKGDYFTERNFDEVREKAQWDLQGYVHPSLKVQSEIMEACVKRLHYSAEITLARWGEFKPSNQVDLQRMADMAIETMKVTSVLARASRSHTETLRNSDMDLLTTISICHNSWLAIRRLANDAEIAEFGAQSRDKFIHENNLQNGGYFSSHPLDRPPVFVKRNQI
jgi:hypothetical protein